jgi:hypothetical protein
MDFRVEIKENDALIIFWNRSPSALSPKAYLVTVSDPIEFSIKIYRTILNHYKSVGDTERFENLKRKGFNYLDYVNK